MRGEAARDDRSKHHDGAIRKIDAGNQDDQRLPKRQSPDHHGLLGDQRQIATVHERRCREGEHDENNDQREQRARDRIGKQAERSNPQ